MITRILVVLIGAAATTALITAPAQPAAADNPTPSDLCARVAYAASFRGDALVTAVAVALAESSCNPAARHVNGAARAQSTAAADVCATSVDRGLFQVNNCAHPDVDDDCAYDAQCNADVAYEMSAAGTNWNPWVVFTNGAYQGRMAEATAAVQRLDINRQPLCRPVTGDWDGNGSVTMGIACKPASGLEMQWDLINVNTGGSPQIRGHFGSHGCTPLTGDWDGDGDDTIGVACRGSSGQISWSLSNGYSGTPSHTFTYGNADRCWPLTGDWDGDGRTSVGVACRSRRSIEITWSLINSLSGGSPSYPPFGYGSTGCRPVTGDWDGDGDAGVGVACPAGGEIRWSLINSLGGGSPSYSPFDFGSVNACWPAVGDWNGNRSTTIGIACAGTELTWSLMNIHSGGAPFVTTGFGTGRSYEAGQGWRGPDWPHWPSPY